MLDIGFSELLLIAVAALVVVGPKDLPVVIRAVAKFGRELRVFYLGAKKQMTQLADEAGLGDIQHELTTIIDLEGKPREAYDVRGLNSLSQNSNREASSGGKPSPHHIAGHDLRNFAQDAERCGGGEGLDEGASRLALHSSRPLTQPSPAGGEGSQAAPLADNFPDSLPGRADA